ncbi:hypothetical protein [Pseudogemmobacter faecipullorum]|uniref:Uncharacterized protein n=1 Tax=Pseudogemmobacter faecipullorum TaxID=2755041 RepID=A0ABS8CLJ6_9RHOB|nr:hypothetical protein [Pseudogemmobacter faecipullorum]MCB5410245.1 hypothetical protein [Pseudogemmobacter faecipullorum]
MNAVLARIVTRYLAGALVAWGLLDPGTAAELTLDPDIAVILGAVFAFVTEVAYGFARHYGWER